MIKIIIERIVEKEFYLENEKDIARTLYDLGYELERNDKLVDDDPKPEKVQALMKLLKQAKPEVQTTVTIKT